MTLGSHHKQQPKFRNNKLGRLRQIAVGGLATVWVMLLLCAVSSEARRLAQQILPKALMETVARF
ncbi:hypothetical protein [Sphaerothrix gracilis]|uniref:hypothetical protein n=1 Tax=Sphaerothrix gracilis TaxID=3151835 RepID=UPI0031FCF342